MFVRRKRMENLDQKEIDRYWSDGAENYSWIIDDELNSFRVEKWREKILGNISSVRNPKILDAGCGPGFFTILLNQAGVQTIGVDGAEKMLQEARAKALHAGLVPEFRRMDCHRLDFADNTFDAVISRNLTHTLRDHKQVYKEWLRVLKPGGTLLIFDANWHLTECDEKLRAESLKRREECIRLYGDAFDKKSDHKDTEEHERTVGGHVLGNKRRPDWDMGLLEGIGYKKISCERSIIEEMWDEKEKLLYGNTPMFMIRAEKEEKA